MDKAFVESAIERVKAFQPSTARTSVLANLEALYRHLRIKGGETLSAEDKKLPASATYARAVDVETDLADLAQREPNS